MMGFAHGLFPLDNTCAHDGSVCRVYWSIYWWHTVLVSGRPDSL